MRACIKNKIALSFLFIQIIVHATTPEKNIITIIGTGYVGLVSGACLAEIGNTVICTDVDHNKIKNLNNNIMPIHEEGLAEIVLHNVNAHRLVFTDNIDQAIQDANIIIIAVGTPMGDNGDADLTFVESAIEMIARNLNSHKIIVTKSTVPVGTGRYIRDKLEYHLDQDPALFSLASNPEFLREGIAINDFLSPDRIIIGTDCPVAADTLYQIYAPIISKGANYIVTDIPTAEMSKYAANAFLAIKISYINEIAKLCDATGADALTVAYCMGLDHRISPYFLNPGPGYGGSCFPKDSQALLYIAQENNLPFYTVEGSILANTMQQQIPVEKLINLFETKLDQSLEGKTVAVLGLAFKPNTDDIRFSPAIVTIENLLNAGAIVKAYDPIAMPHMQKLFPSITYGETLYDTVNEADAIIIITDWKEIRDMDLTIIKKLVKQPVIIDSRNSLNKQTLKELGFIGDSIGQSFFWNDYQSSQYFDKRKKRIHLDVL